MAFKDNLSFDLDLFMSDFSERAIYDNREISVQFFEKSEMVYDRYFTGVETFKQYLLAKREDVEGLLVGDVITVKNKLFEIIDVSFKRSDLVRLILSEQRDRPFN